MAALVARNAQLDACSLPVVFSESLCFRVSLAGIRVHQSWVSGKLVVHYVFW
ncbi:hypothetical protein DPMN_163231 [Dreissena polymorpha]|uniref:Uncharacterized protein n=1 Tax=Dreissena polymorpha TaxID=45954 RepID=A0A9D4ESW8_DREPO|nr:hypothetical protein DPMN_163231 [Dreissena polymorpha]